jgi:hypothetical protein
MNNTEENKNKIRLYKLMIGVFIIFIITLLTTYLVIKYNGQWKSLTWMLNGDQTFTFRSLILGMVSAMVFGFIDNAGLFFGMDALDPYLPGGPLTKAGWGNTFSDGIGAFLGAFIGKIVSVSTGFEGGPIYGDFVGIIIGCILGIYIPQAITGKS